MINWTKEDIEFVCNSMINPAMTQVLKFIETSNDGHNRMIESLTSALDRVSYLHAREISFLKTIIINHCHLDPEKLNVAREEYFKQFDELNKKEN